MSSLVSFAKRNELSLFNCGCSVCEEMTELLERCGPLLEEMAEKCPMEFGRFSVPETSSEPKKRRVGNYRGQQKKGYRQGSNAEKEILKYQSSKELLVCACHPRAFGENRRREGDLDTEVLYRCGLVFAGGRWNC